MYRKPKPEPAGKLDAEFEILLHFLCYTGCRLGEALNLTCNEVRASELFAYVRTSKNDEPRAVFLPPHLVTELAQHPRGLDRGDGRLFRFHQGGGLRNLLNASTAMASGLPKPKRREPQEGLSDNLWSMWKNRGKSAHPTISH